MGKIILNFLVIVSLYSCKPIYITTPAGRKITQRKFNRITKRIVRNAVRSLSKEELNSLKDVRMNVAYDTIKK